IFLYSPMAIFGLVGLLWPLWTRNRVASALFLTLTIILLLCYATLGNWLGGRSYGSRYLVVVLPYLAVGWAALLAALGSRRRVALLVAVSIAGFLIQMPGVLVDYAKVSQSSAELTGGLSTEARQWQWNASALALNTRALRTAVPENISYVLGRAPLPLIAPPSGQDDRDFSQQFAFSLDFWWLYLFYLRALSRALVLALVAGWTVWIGLCVWRLRDAMRAATTAPSDVVTS
ncbi:MAG: hypothetical protein ABI652_07115, partial [Acidobacteriota bacterium]